MKTIFLVMAVFLLIPTAARAQTPCTPVPPVNRCGEDPSVYRSFSYPGVTPSHQVFCGKDALWAGNPNSPTGFPAIYNSASVGGWEIDAQGNCFSSHGGSAGHFNSRVQAPVAEVRGWVIFHPGADLITSSSLDTNDGEQEAKFEVALDVGWTPAPEVVAAGIVPINTIAAVNQWIPATNTIQFGGRDLKPNTQEAWGGLNTVIIHVEIDAWGPSRGSEAFGNSWIAAMTQPTAVSPQMITGWLHGAYTGSPLLSCGGGVCFSFPTSQSDVWWPFPLVPLNGQDMVTSQSPPIDMPFPRYGSYVRMVGTLWEDEPHLVNDSDWPNVADRLAKQCWWAPGAYNASHGWAEMHSVDYLAVIQPPIAPHTVASYVACANNNDTPSVASFTENVFPTGPYPLSRLTGVSYDLDASHPMANQNLSNPTPVTWQPPNSFFTVSETVTDTAQSAGTFKVAIEAVMSCSPTCTDRCGDDGCGGFCNNNCNSGIGHACPSGAGACTCSAPGWAICSSTGACQTTSSCAPPPPPPPPPPPGCPLGTIDCGDGVCIRKPKRCP